MPKTFQQLDSDLPTLVRTNPVATFDADASAGMALYVSGNSRVDRASKSTGEAPAFAVGLAVANTLASAVGEYVTNGELELADWTDVTGSALLTPHVVYYLGDGGRLTTTYPTSAGEYVVIVGPALSETKIKVAIHWLLHQPN